MVELMEYSFPSFASYHSGNNGSAFVEVLVGRASLNEYQVQYSFTGN